MVKELIRTFQRQIKAETKIKLKIGKKQPNFVYLIYICSQFGMKKISLEIVEASTVVWVIELFCEARQTIIEF